MMRPVLLAAAIAHVRGHAVAPPRRLDESGPGNANGASLFFEPSCSCPDAAALVMQAYSSGQYEACGPEQLMWTHHSSVYDGFSGCVGESGYNPCAQDGFDGIAASDKPYLYDEATGTCTSTGMTMANRSFWILWGHPQDKYELTRRTGINPVVSFPFNRGPYPSMLESGGSHGDDAADARAVAKDLLAYLGAFTAAELDDWDVSFTEGAEQGHIQNIAAAATLMARETCNRDLYMIFGAPAYGYDLSTAARLAEEAGGWLDCSDCGNHPCWEITINQVGWLPGTAVPTAVGGDGVTYSADSTDSNSPWLETVVFPENPSGWIKTVASGGLLIPDSLAKRRVCDGVYNWPMYYGGESNGTLPWTVPIDKRPECLAWTFSVTKVHSASVRAGFVIGNTALDTAGIVAEIAGNTMNMASGLYSEWSWFGQMQIYNMIMASDPDGTFASMSWVGEYSALMKEKWDYMIDGFAGCPYIEITNEYAGAYVWFKKIGSTMGLETSFISAFFSDTMGVTTTTYYWGFRGADPADYYGAGYTTMDFARLQLYRDLSVYEEVGRRAAIVCAGGTVDGFLSADEYIGSRRRRRLSSNDEPLTYEAHYDNLKESTNGRLTHEQLDGHASRKVLHEEAHRKVEAFCAPEYTTDCLFKHTGSLGGDVDIDAKSGHREHADARHDTPRRALQSSECEWTEVDGQTYIVPWSGSSDCVLPPTASPTMSFPPTPVPTPVPTRTPIVFTTIGLSGIACTDFDADVFRTGMDATIGTGDATFSNSTCVDDARRRLGGDDAGRRLSLSVSVTTEVTIDLATVSVAGADSALAHIMGQLNATTLESNIITASQAAVTSGSRRRLDMSSISVSSVSVDTFTPTPAPTPAPSDLPTPTPTLTPTTSGPSPAPTSMPTPVPTSQPTTATNPPTKVPTAMPTAAPVPIPTFAPSCPYQTWFGECVTAAPTVGISASMRLTPNVVVVVSLIALAAAML